MGKNENENGKLEDVEEGEISDSASVEEISEEDFNKQEVVVVKESKPPIEAASRVWTMTDLYKYQAGRGYTSSLYNLAWAQAVQNKPLNDLFIEVDPDDDSKRSSTSSSSVNSTNREEKKGERVVIDDSSDEMEVKVVDFEKEEGELEEGEIDLDSEPVVKAAAEGSNKEDQNNVDGSEAEPEDEELEKEVKLIREALETVSVAEAEISFEAVCSKLHNTLDSLRQVIQQNKVLKKDALVQLLFSAVRSVNLVFGSMSHELKEQYKKIYSRFLQSVKINDPPLFSLEQRKEIEVMISSLQFAGVLLGARCGEKEKETQVLGGVNKKDNDALVGGGGLDLTTTNKSSATESLYHNKPNLTLEAPKTGVSGFKSRGILLPLLDLHKDHDADSLPSPTRETTPSLPVHRVMTVGDGIVKSGLPPAKTVLNAEANRMHPYETDALKAVSSYQQKFGRSSFFMNDRLPSPTPSEESADGDGDTSGEVSSLSTVGNVRPVNPPILSQQIASPSPPRPESSTSLGTIPAKNPIQLSSGSTSTVKTTAKSRDPRLRYTNTSISVLDQNHSALHTVNNTPKVEPTGAMVGLRKQKMVEDSNLDGPSLKRQRNAMENSGNVEDGKHIAGTGGWLEDTDMVGPQIMNRNQLAENVESDPRRIGSGVPFSNPATGQSNLSFMRNEQIQVTGNSANTVGEQVSDAGTNMTSLPNLWKDIAVNPTMLINILKMGQQRLALEAQQKLAVPAKSTMHSPSAHSILGAIPAVNVTGPQSSGMSPTPAGTMQAPAQMAAMDDLGRIRMKPRDPRRVLHNNTIQRTGSISSEQLKTDLAPISAAQGNRDNQKLTKKDDHAEMKPVPSQSLVPPDISLPFTKSLMNIADIVSVSPASTTSSIVSQTTASQPMQIKSDKIDAKPVITSSGQQIGAALVSEVGAAGSLSQNTWRDVEHLFEGFDEQQKAAIQKERARRIEEQKKMFAASKLCLVLDLDHTLLNSAKFVEVDPVHDEILRKKEEQDREKPYRHLFRFPHMAMWTKLRPGIWNFLEKASKLYELHLYTMGNKLYATEMAKVLDPKGVLFNGRVISRGDDGDLLDGVERVPKSKDLEGVLGMESAVVIIDDSVRVWPHNKLNLIVVERYIYFPCSRRQFGLPGPSLLEIDHDERPEDGTLASSLAVIEKIHQNFFTHQSLDDADVRNILASEQRKILAGCRVVFSRVFPVGEANPHLHPLWQTAEQFGAVCTNQIDEQVTHVVANSLGTDKVNWALSTGRFVVHPGWVEASALLYRRANEQDFAIKP